MPQYKIEKAYFALWGREVTVHEFEEFRRTHPYYWSFRDLRCVHCDDPIEFVRRDGGIFHRLLFGQKAVFFGLGRLQKLLRNSKTRKAQGFHSAFMRATTDLANMW